MIGQSLESMFHGAGQTVEKYEAVAVATAVGV